MSIEYFKAGHIATFILNRPQTLNALDLKTLNEFHEALKDFHDDENAWVGIITGAGKEAFCSGIDITSSLNKNHISQTFPPTIMRGFEIAKPLIAAINGAALGGGMELAMACDIRIASDNALFGQPEVKLGFIPAWGGTQRLARQLAYCHAAELILTGKSINAREAYRIGLINQVVSQDQLENSSREWAETICQAGPLAVRAAKEAMLKGSELPLVDGLNLETALATYLRNTLDFQEGIQAFQEKRKPDFKAT
jgi:enoyl-CoA hydratase/carnithine racemase